MTTASISKKQALAYAVAGAAAMGTTATAYADFSGPYDHANWTFIPAGDASFTPTLTTLQLVGSDSGVGGTAGYLIAADANGVVSFDWNYSSSDVGGWDYGGFYLNGVFTTLAFNSTQGAGNFSTNVNAGDVFGFWVHSVDGGFGPGVLDVSNFSAPVAVPEPGTLGLLALGTLGGALGFRRRRS